MAIQFFLRNIAPHTRVKDAKRYPIRALDVGIGAGRLGFLFRDCMEFRSDRYFKEDWVYTMDGIEVHQPYHNPVWDYCYNRVDIGNIRSKINQVEDRDPYDFVFFMDVIEHLPKDEGIDILSRLHKRCKNLLLLSFPDGSDRVNALKQGFVHHNKHESHISLWTEADLKDYQIMDADRPSCFALKGGHGV